MKELGKMKIHYQYMILLDYKRKWIRQYWKYKNTCWVLLRHSHLHQQNKKLYRTLIVYHYKQSFNFTIIWWKIPNCQNKYQKQIRPNNKIKSMMW